MRRSRSRRIEIGIGVAVLLLLSAPVLGQGDASISRASVSSLGEEGNGPSGRPAVSGDGRFVVFPSLASNLVEGDNNDSCDIFVHDRVSGETTRVSVSSAGVEGNKHSCAVPSLSFKPAVSHDGRYVAFLSDAVNLVSGDGTDIFKFQGFKKHPRSKEAFKALLAFSQYLQDVFSYVGK